MRIRALAALGATLGALALGPVAAFGGPSGAVVVVPIHGTIDEGMAHLVQRSVAAATADRAAAVVLDIDSFGGLVSAATEIRDAALGSKVPVDAYVSGRAWSAAALIALSSEHLTMAPGSSIGAAEPIPKTVKTVSALRSEFAATAQQRGRNPRLAEAMVDANAPAAGFKVPGAILTLTAREAVSAHIAGALAPDLDRALAGFGLAGAARTSASYTLAEQVARFATDPTVSGLLISLGLLGLLVEMQTLHAVAGIIGVAALALFFGTHVYAGFSDALVVGLALAGVVGILLELHVLPGHGVAGIAGGLMLLAAVVLAFGPAFFSVAVESIAIAIVVSVGCFVLFTRFAPENAFVRRLAFSGVQGRDYVASEDHHALVGHAGFATSYLRPSGVAAIEGKRVDVLTEGEFVPAGAPVVVTRVEGARIFVRPG